MQLISFTIIPNKSHPPQHIIPTIVVPIGINLWFFSFITLIIFCPGAINIKILKNIKIIPNIFIFRTYNEIKMIITKERNNNGQYRQNLGIIRLEKKQRYIIQNDNDITPQIELLNTGIKKDILYQ